MLETVSKQNLLDTTIYHLVTPTYKRIPILLNEEYNLFISSIIEEMDDITIIEFNIISDHAHFLVEKQPLQTVPQIMKKLKGRTSYYFFKQYPEIKVELGKGKLWTRKYHYTEISSLKQLNNTIRYIKQNYDRHKPTL